MATLVGAKGRVVSFEPDPDARNLLEKNLQLNCVHDCVRVESIAVSDAVGEARFFSRRGDTRSSLRLLSNNPISPEAVESISVQTTTIDEYLERNNLPAPKLVKIDIEGAEIHALRGAPNLLASKALVICELHPFAWSAFGATFAELQRIVKSGGRRMRHLDSQKELEGEPHYGCVLLEK